jgi:hypothetical protein
MTPINDPNALPKAGLFFDGSTLYWCDITSFRDPRVGETASGVPIRRGDVLEAARLIEYERLHRVCRKKNENCSRN